MLMQSDEVYKIIIGLVAVLVSSWGMFGFFIIRWIKASDDSFKELYERTRVPMEEHVTNNLNRFVLIETKMENQNEKIYENKKILAEITIKLDNLISDHKHYHRKD